MRVKTLASLVRGGKALVLLRLKTMFTTFYRVCFLACLADSVVLERLSRGAVSEEDLSGGPGADPTLRSAAQAWLYLGVRLGVLRKDAAGYSLRGFLARRLAAPGNDAIRALVREVACLHHLHILQAPGMLEKGLLFDPARQNAEYGDLIAQSSRTLEPFIFELIDRFFPASGPVRLLEAGCGHAGYIRYAAQRNASLSAVGLEIDDAVAKSACHAIRERGLEGRVQIVEADVRAYHSPEPFDILTLYNNIYYFPVEERVGTLGHLLGLLRPGGRIVITTGCLNGSIEFELVNLIHAGTRGWGRLPENVEMLRQMEDAGFERCEAVELIPGNGYYAFIGHRPVRE
jgi:SAM-dependent methyltransferase